MNRIAGAALALFTLIPAATADVTLPAIFSDHMVLQRQRPVPVWGTASPGETVQVSIAGQNQTVRADKNGRWTVKLAAMKAGGPHDLVVKASTTQTVKDVLVGEVWLASGQSNMAMQVSRCRDAEKE